MAKLYPALIDQATGGKLRRLLRAHPQAGGLGLSAPLGREVEDGRIRIGIVYGGITAATYSGLAMTAAGTGEVKFHKIKHDGSAVVELEDEAEKAFSLSQTALADGLEVICFRDQTITDPDKPHTPQPGWIAVPLSDTPGRRGYGKFHTQRDTSATDAGLFYLPSTGTELFNSDELNPVVAAELDGMGPNFRALVVDEPGLYRVTLEAELVYLSPGEPGGTASYQDLVGTVSGGATENFCQSFHFRQETIWLFKNANFGSPNVTDGIAVVEPWNLYFCSQFKRFREHVSGVFQLDVGDTLSLWQDHSTAVGSSLATVVAHFSVHLSSREDLEASP